MRKCDDRPCQNSRISHCDNENSRFNIGLNFVLNDLHNSEVVQWLACSDGWFICHILEHRNLSDLERPDVIIYVTRFRPW